MRITFLLPLAGTHPIGGFKVVYEYANYLVGRGHSVSVVHPQIFRVDQPLSSLPLRQQVRAVRDYVRHGSRGTWRPTSWFVVHPRVKLLWRPSLAAAFIPDADLVVASSWETAEWTAAYPPSKGRKFYLIQHLETWSGPNKRVYDTWTLPLEKIVIAKWLEEIATKLGQSSHLIDNGLDFNRFGLDRPIEGRDPTQVMMLFHEKDWKGSPDGLAAFRMAQQQVPELKLTLFGMNPRPADLEPGIAYHQDPPQSLLRELYNRTAIFLSPSWTEGFGLPGAEALQCGAALAVTDIPGSAAYAIDGETALLSPPKDSQAMAENILRLYGNEQLRVRLATEGHRHIQQFTWENAGRKLEAVLAGRNGTADSLRE